jgi:hypothetical protein
MWRLQMKRQIDWLPVNGRLRVYLETKDRNSIWYTGIKQF